MGRPPLFSSAYWIIFQSFSIKRPSYFLDNIWIFWLQWTTRTRRCWWERELFRELPSHHLLELKANHENNWTTITNFLTFEWQKLKYFERRLQNSVLFTSQNRNWHKKSWAILQNFNSWMIKLIKTQILPNCQVQNGCFWCNRKFYHQKMEK